MPNLLLDSKLQIIVCNKVFIWFNPEMTEIPPIAGTTMALRAYMISSTELLCY